MTSFSKRDREQAMVALSIAACMGTATLGEVTDSVEVCRDAHILAWAAYRSAEKNLRVHKRGCRSPGGCGGIVSVCGTRCACSDIWRAEAVAMIACGWEP